MEKWDMLNVNDPKFDLFGNRNTLEQLIPLIKNNRIIPFVGAGLSIDIYGSWGTALKHMMKGHFAGRADDAKDIVTLIDSGDYEAAAQKIHEKLYATPFQDQLVASFKESLITDKRLKRMSVRYLPRIFKESLVITTNFDKVLERAFLMEQYSFEEKLVLRHLTGWQAVHVSRGSLHYLIKIHGCVSAPDEVVMTESSYDGLYNKSPLHIKRLNGILIANNLLFLGCSLKADRTVELLRGVSRRDHYAILPMDGEAGEEAFEQRRAFMADELQMHCIWYPKGEHHYVEDILEYIYAAITDQRKAVEAPAPAKTAETPQPAAKPLVKNEIHTIGRWEGKPMEWLVLDVQPDRALLIAKICLIRERYHEEPKPITWAECSLRKKVLPQLLEEIFDDKERSRVLHTNNKNPDNEEWNTPGGSDTEDRLFLLSIDEAKQYFPYDKARIARLNGKAWWWLRSPGSRDVRAAYVDCDGYLYVSGSHVSSAEGGVRPAFWLNLKS